MRHALLVLVVLLGCSGNQRAATVQVEDVELAATINWSSGYLYPTVIVTRSGIAVDNLYVQLNDTDLSYDAGIYSGADIPADIGDPVVLTIETSRGYEQLSTVVPDVPTITSPTTSGSPYAVSSEILVQWLTLSPAPVDMNVWVWEGYTSDYATYSAGDSTPIDIWLDGSLTWVKLPANGVVAHNSSTSPGYSTMTLEVRAINSVDLSGFAIKAGSFMRVISRRGSEAFTTE